MLWLNDAVDTPSANLAANQLQTSAAPRENVASGEMAAVPTKRFLPVALARELFEKSGAELLGLKEAEFAEALESVGAKNNFGLDPGIEASAKQQESFWRALHLEELAIARGCALGRDPAWERFLAQYREPLKRIAIEMTGAVSLGEELADSLYSELFGLVEREGKRWSPLLRYSGRGSLIGWLRAVLAQRRVNQYRKTSRETELADHIEPAAPAADPAESQQIERLEVLQRSLFSAVSTLSAEERFILSAYYLDTSTLAALGAVLRVHEATVSRKLKRAVEQVHKEVLKSLMALGLSRRAAEEAFGIDPRDVDINLRKLLQNSEGGANFQEEGGK